MRESQCESEGELGETRRGRAVERNDLLLHCYVLATSKGIHIRTGDDL